MDRLIKIGFRICEVQRWGTYIIESWYRLHWSLESINHVHLIFTSLHTVSVQWPPNSPFMPCSLFMRVWRSLVMRMHAILLYIYMTSVQFFVCVSEFVLYLLDLLPVESIRPQKFESFMDYTNLSRLLSKQICYFKLLLCRAILCRPVECGLNMLYRILLHILAELSWLIMLSTEDNFGNWMSAK